jgi:hypothetical protein
MHIPLNIIPSTLSDCDLMMMADLPEDQINLSLNISDENEDASKTRPCFRKLFFDV